MKTNYPLFDFPGIRYCNYSLSFFLFLHFLLFTLPGNAQVNAYAKVTSISATRLNLSNVNQSYHTFQQGEQIIIMQMQDNIIGSNTANNANFGNLSVIASAGLYEVATISSIAGLPGYINISTALQNNYNIGANRTVQIISFRKMSASNYTTTSNITALQWNGNVGGVVAMQVPGTLTLAHTITADGRGFRGGAVSDEYEGDCAGTTYRTNSDNHGAKGEGIFLSTASNQERGRGHLLNGGGGGAANNAGGGGGGHFTTGGQGGGGYTCDVTPAGGLGGIALGSHITGLRIFMGGGGGGGQQNNDEGSIGSNGGGIVFIKAATLTTSCSGNVRISANGGASLNAGRDGAGGAGAGGTVVLDVNNFNVPGTCPLIIQSNGGNGGSVTHEDSHGGGGGGGQGVIMYLSSLPAANITGTTNNGAGGQNYSGGPTAGGGGGINNAGIVIGGSTLPVTLVSFDLEKRGNKIVLHWTATESHHTQFNVQHSIDGTTFNQIGQVNGTGNASGAQQYDFIHYQPDTRKNYYRLEMNTPSGRKEYSIIVGINGEAGQHSLDVYPNPARQQFAVRLNGTTNKNWSLAIRDLNGKTVYHTTDQSVNNLIRVYLDKTLVPGIYTIQLTSNDERQTGKLIIK